MKIFDLKKVIFILLVLPFIISSCGDDDDSSGFGTSDLIGSWALTSDAASGCTDETYNYSEVANSDNQFCDTDAGTTYCETTTVTFSENGAGIILYQSYENGTTDETESSTFSYTFENNSLSFCDSFGSNCTVFEVTNSGNTFTTTMIDATTGCTATTIFEKL